MKIFFIMLMSVSISTSAFDLMGSDADDFLNDMRSENEILEKMEKEQALAEKEEKISMAKEKRLRKKEAKSSRGIASVQEEPELPSQEDAPSLNGFMDLDF